MDRSPSHDARIAAFAQVSSALALLTDGELTRLVDRAEPLATGIGGSTLALEIDGVKVFAKRVRLTELESRRAHRFSTANLFDLPTHYHRNVGSAGFGVWRELAANVMTTGWVLSGQLECFALMYHWRVLDGASSATAAPVAAEWADRDAMVRFWHGSEQVAARIDALAAATASVLIFLEHLPWTMSDWLALQRASGPAAMEAACAWVERTLVSNVSTMNRLGLLHGDAHHGNVLTDGRRLYFADLGLAMSARFELSDAEANYLRDNANLDLAYVLARWVGWLVKAYAPTATRPEQRMGLIRDIARGLDAFALMPSLPRVVEGHIRRGAPLAAALNDFYDELHHRDRTARFPSETIDALLAAWHASG